MPISDSNTTDQYDNTVTVINGGTDNTTIGNVGDRLKVDAAFTAGSITFPSIDPSQYRFEEMSKTRDTALSTSFETLYSYSGSGFLESFTVNFDNDSEVRVKLTVDGNNLFLLSGTDLYLKDLKDNNVYDVKDVSNATTVAGFGLHDNALRFEPRYPISFSTSVLIEARTTTSKKYKAGFVEIIKVS